MRVDSPLRAGEDGDRPDDVVSPNARICEFCGSILSGQTGWSYAGNGFDWRLRSFGCFGECNGARGSVTEVEISIDDPGDGAFETWRESAQRNRNPYGFNQSTFQPALGLDPETFPDGTYHFVRITPYVVEFRPPIGTDVATVQDWVRSGAWDWAENVEVVPTMNEELDRPVVLFRDVHNGPTSKRSKGP